MQPERSRQSSGASEGAARTNAPPAPAALPSPRRVAVVGAGYVARFHLEALHELPEVAVVAICDRQLSRAERLAARWGVPRVTRDCRELADLDVDVAHVLVPPNAHEPVTRQLLELGIGALVEKPFTTDAGAARSLAELARKRRLPLAANHNQPHNPAFRLLAERVAGGAIGRPGHVRLHWSSPLPQLEDGQLGHWMFAAPQNVVYEQAVHPFSMLHALIGSVRGVTVRLLGSQRLPNGAEFHHRWLIAAEAERGTAEVLLAFTDLHPRCTVEVIGSEGVIEADLQRGLVHGEAATAWPDAWDGFLAGWRRGGQLRRDALRGVTGYAAHLLRLRPRCDPYFAGMRGSVRAFHRALAEGGLPDAEDGVATVEWCDAVAAALGPRPLTIAAGASRAPAPAPLPPRPGEVVLLGGSGFIGRALARNLLARDVPVTITGRAAPARAEKDGLRGARRLAADLENADSLAAAVAGARVVVHLATGGGETWEEIERAMVHGSVAAAEAALAAGVERFVYVSSIAALYLGSDAGAARLRDASPVDPRPDARDLYSRGKVEAELALSRLQRSRGLPLVIVRPGVVLGRGGRTRHSGFGLWVRDAHCVGWGLGRHPLPVVAVDDVAEAIARVVLFQGGELHGRALNLASRAGLSAAEAVAVLARESGRALRFHPRPLLLSQLLEIGKWTIKRVGGRAVPFPAYRDLKSRALVPQLLCDTARDLLGWHPLDDREAFLDATLRDRHA